MLDHSREEKHHLINGAGIIIQMKKMELDPYLYTIFSNNFQMWTVKVLGKKEENFSDLELGGIF